MVTQVTAVQPDGGKGKGSSVTDRMVDGTVPVASPKLFISSFQEDAARAQAKLEAARFNDFRRASGGWSWSLDEYGCFSEISGRFFPLLGRRPSEFLGMPFENLGRFEQNDQGQLPFTQARRQSTAFRDQLVVMHHANGHDIAFHLSGVPMFDGANRVVGYQGTAICITDVSSHQPAIPVMETTRRAFLSNISHELRTPLNAILGFADTMRMEMFGTLDGRYRNYCGDIVDAGQHLLALIEDMLDASDLENGSVGLERASVKLVDVATEVKALLEGQASKMDVALDVANIIPDLRAYCDRRRLKQILVNLMSNAVKFTPRGGQVGISAKYIGLRGETAAITVWDTGSGISSDRHEAVFERFFRSGEDGYTSDINQGIGLGLHISREFARRMGGDITLISKVGEGASFTLTLPNSAPA